MEPTDPLAILLVDDSARFRELARVFIQARAGAVFSLTTAGSAAEALYRITTFVPQIVLVDLRMPGMGGLELIPHLRRRLPDAGIVALTNFDRNEYQRAALAAGADAFVSKGEMPTQLLDTMWAVYTRRHPQADAAPGYARARGRDRGVMPTRTDPLGERLEGGMGRVIRTP